MLAVCKRENADLGVQRVRHGDNRGVNICFCEHFFVVCVGFQHRIFFFCCMQLVRINIADSAHRHALDFAVHNARKMRAAHIADADDADLYNFHVSDFPHQSLSYPQ